jgi:hypothetical protein
MAFEYPWTCEEIDGNITPILHKICDYFVEQYEKHFGLASYDFTPDMQSDVEMETQAVYDRIRDHIEAIRLTNSGIRAAAEDQVSRLENQLEDERKEYNRLENACINQIEQLEQRIEELDFVIKRDGHGKEK